MYQQIENYFLSLDQQIGNSRKQVLDQLADYLIENEHPQLNFICTHNSRRSHLSQIWAQVCAYHFKIPIAAFSGGTQTTAFHPNAIAALARVGFKISRQHGENPKYQIAFSEDQEAMTYYSKTYDDASNPQADFVAIMTCSGADEDCVLVHGADARIKLFFEDPKIADNTPQEAQTYDERCAQIANEIRYVFSSVKRRRQKTV